MFPVLEVGWRVRAPAVPQVLPTIGRGTSLA